MLKSKSKILNAKVSLTLNKFRNGNRPAPTISLNAASGDMEGEIILLWEPVAGANTYVVQMSRGAGEPKHWIQEDIVTSTYHIVSKLKSGVKYWFRVAAVSSAGQGCWSKLVNKISP